MVRVCFALGSWQLLTLAAALREADAADVGADTGREDHLVLYETAAVSDALAEAMRAIAPQVRPWRRIVEAFDLLGAVPRKPTQRELDALIVALRDRLGLARIDEIWLCWLTRPAEKLILEAYADARVMLYEDGLTSYLPPQRPMRAELPADARGLAAAPVRLRAWLDAQWPARRFRRHRSGIDPRHASRVAGAWMVLADVWPAPPPLDGVPWHLVAPSRLRAALAACAALPAVTAFIAPERPRPAVLILGQSLSRWGAMTREAEFGVYAEVVERAVALGYDVWWKEHPRVQQAFYGELALQAPPERLRELGWPFALPIELIADRLRLSACIAGFSAALYYLQRLHGVPGYTFADALAPSVDGAWALQNEMVRRTVPPLDRLPAATDAGPVPAAVSS